VARGGQEVYDPLTMRTPYWDTTCTFLTVLGPDTSGTYGATGSNEHHGPIVHAEPCIPMVLHIRRLCMQHREHVSPFYL
jgi:hypothetical protein